MSGTAALRWCPSRGSAAVRRGVPTSRHRDPRHARSGGRLALAAAMAAALLLSPGARDACAGCCRDGAPAVPAPLAAGVAPVHSCCAVRVAAPGDCCSAPAGVASCDAAGGAAPAAERSDCRCHLDPLDGLPADPVRRSFGERRVDDVPLESAATVALPTVADLARPLRAGGAPPDPGRPVRILYGVWRN